MSNTLDGLIKQAAAADQFDILKGLLKLHDECAAAKAGLKVKAKPADAPVDITAPEAAPKKRMGRPPKKQ